MTNYPKYLADRGDAVVDKLLDLIDAEPADMRDRLMASIKAGNHHAYSQPDGHSIVVFDDVPGVQYEIVPPRLDA